MTEKVDKSRSDETLGESLDRYLAVRRKSDCAIPPAENDDLRELTAIVDRLDEWAQSVESTDAGVADVPPSLGKFQVLHAIGRGGQSKVWLAIDPDLGRHVVIKVHDQQDGNAANAAMNEGRALASVRSPYVATCFGVERDGETTYVVMECVPGSPLSEVAHRRQYSQAEAVELIGKLAQGLAEIHNRGLIHGDIKPGNIVIGDDGVPKLIDLGLARSRHQSPGSCRGTAAYMAPEQARGQLERVDHRSDIFSLGAVFYELLAGTPLYAAETKQETLRLSQACQLSSADDNLQGISPGIRAACLRCLAEEPSKRFQSALELILELKAAVRRPVRFRLAAASILVVALLGLVLFWFWPAELIFKHFLPNSAQPSAKSQNNKHRSWDEIIRLSRQPTPSMHDLQQHCRQELALQLHVTDHQLDEVGKLVVQRGVDVNLQVEADRGCWLAVFVVELTPGEDPVTYCLFPRDEDDSNFLAMGEHIDIESEAPEISRASEFLYAVASSEEWDPRTSGTWIGTYPVYEFEIDPSPARTTPRSLRRSRKVGEFLFPFQVLPNPEERSM